jgi:hypothetical protein
VEKSRSLWTSPPLRVLGGAPRVAETDKACGTVPEIPDVVHNPSTAEGLVSVRSGGASRMVHTATTTATFSIDHLYTQETGGAA